MEEGAGSSLLFRPLGGSCRMIGGLGGLSSDTLMKPGISGPGLWPPGLWPAGLRPIGLRPIGLRPGVRGLRELKH